MTAVFISPVLLSLFGIVVGLGLQTAGHVIQKRQRTYSGSWDTLEGASPDVSRVTAKWDRSVDGSKYIACGRAHFTVGNERLEIPDFLYFGQGEFGPLPQNGPETYDGPVYGTGTWTLTNYHMRQAEAKGTVYGIGWGPVEVTGRWSIGVNGC